MFCAAPHVTLVKTKLLSDFYQIKYHIPLFSFVGISRRVFRLYGLSVHKFRPAMSSSMSHSTHMKLNTGRSLTRITRNHANAKMIRYHYLAMLIGNNNQRTESVKCVDWSEGTSEKHSTISIVENSAHKQEQNLKASWNRAKIINMTELSDQEWQGQLYIFALGIFVVFTQTHVDRHVYLNACRPIWDNHYIGLLSVPFAIGYTTFVGETTYTAIKSTL